MQKARKVLVTGCAGFIGSNLCDALVNKGWEVVGLDNLMTGHRKNIEELEKKESFTFVWGDVRNIESLRALFQEFGITHVAHQAARGSVPKSVENPILTNEINISGTLNLLWVAKEHRAERFVCAISSSVYGNTPTLPKVETMPYNALSPYAVTKAAKEMYCKIFYDLYQLPTIGLRYFNVYGRRQDPNGDYAAVIPRWITKAIKNEDLPINGDGKQTRDFTYIDDVIEANILALETDNQEAFGKGMNIGYSGKIDITTLANNILELTDSQGKIVYGEPRKGDVQDSYADIHLAQKLLGYTPKVSIHEGIKKTISWYRNSAS